MAAMMRTLLAILVLGSLAAAPLDAQPPAPPPPPPQLAVTIDDLPISQPSWHTPAQMQRITAGLMAALAKHGVQAVGFVNANKLEVDGKVDPARQDLLRTWLASGHELGNHTRSHPSLHEVAPAAWMDDVVAGETGVKKLVEASGGRWHWFRHPYLHVGTSSQIQAETYAFLADRGYTVAPVSLDNSEWVYGRAYARAWNDGDEELQRRLGEDYLRYMLEVVDYYERQTDLIVGRPIPHVLLIHAYALNAEWLDPLLTRLAERGYRWVTLAEALADPVYARPIDGYTGKGGITWLHRWGITAGLDRTLFRGEPEVPAWVEELPGGAY
jgi:peptidoglycan/xylan/chitin deacetylase (PgdA/CDA1 family)